jgi:hypothetical protein
MTKHSIRCLTVLAAVAAIACRSHHTDPRELALAVAASDSVDDALMDSLAGPGAFVAGQAGMVSSLSACDDHVDSRSWSSFGSLIIELELPPGYSGSQVGESVRWTGPTGWIRAQKTRDQHTSWTGTITSECDVYISGAPTHIDLVSTGYSLDVHALIRVQNAPPIGVDAQARSIDAQAQLLHAIRAARVSSAWGR